MTRPHKQSAQANHTAVIKKRVEDIVFARNLPMEKPLGTLMSKSDFRLVETALWDEYQVHVAPIDTIKDIAYILQQKIEK